MLVRDVKQYVSENGMPTDEDHILRMLDAVAPRKTRASSVEFGWLEKHRSALAQSGDAAYWSDAEQARVVKTLAAHLPGTSKANRERFVAMIWETQDQKPFFHVDGALPFCWNSPKNGGKAFIVYEWGHLEPRSVKHMKHQLENLCLQSQRCNNHVQAGASVDTIEEWSVGSMLALRIQHVQRQRKALFARTEWKELKAQMRVEMLAHARKREAPCPSGQPA